MKSSPRRLPAPGKVVPGAAARALRPLLSPALALARGDSDAAALYLLEPDGRLRLTLERGFGSAFVRVHGRIAPGHGIVGRAWTGRRAVSGLRKGDDPAGLDGALAREGRRAAIAAPIRVGRRPVGVLLLAGHEADAGRAERLREAARLLGSALDLAGRHQAAREASAQLATVRELARAMTQALDPSEVLRLLVEDAAALLGSTGAGVLLFRGGEGELELVAATAPLDASVGARVALGGSLHEEAIRTLRPVVEEGARGLAGWDALGAHEVRRAAVVPLKIGAEAIGTLFVCDSNAGAFDPEDGALLATLAEPAAIAIQNAQLVDELARKRHESDQLRDLAVSLQRLDLESVLDRVTQAARDLSASEFAFVALETIQEGLRFEATAGGLPELRGRRVSERSGTRWVFERGEPLITPDARAEERLDRAQGPPLGAACLVPILGAEGPLGVLGVGYSEPRPIPSGQVRLLGALAAHASAAIQNARLFRAVQAGKEEWEETFDAIGEGIASVDREGVVYRANRAFAHFVQRDVRDVVGHRLSALLEGRVPEGGVDPAALVETALRNRQPAEGVCGLRSPYRVLRAVAYPIPSGGAVVFRDITAFASLEERHQRILEAVHDAIVITNLNGGIVFANPAAAELFACDASALLGRPLAEFLPDDPALRDEVRSRAARALEGEPQRFESRIRRVDGELRLVDASNAPLLELGRAVGTVALLRDVTEHKALQEHLVQTDKLAALGSLLSGVAHELNNPLASISSFAQLLNDPAAPQAQRDLAAEIHRESERAARVVQHLLTFARLRDPRREVVDLAQVLDDVLALRALNLSAEALEVRRDYGPGLFVYGDSHALGQVFFNIVLNAQQAMAQQAGPHRLSLAAGRAGDRILVRIDDTGSGIPAEHLNRIFDPFFTTKPEGEGTGLGLSVGYGIVHDHGGEISATNPPEGGARIVVSLPARTAPPAAAPEAAAEGAAVPEDAGGAGLRILVIDDEPAIRRSLSALLSRRGHDVETAADGAEALEKLLRRDYDAVVSDIRMPGLGGKALFRRLSAERPDVVRRIVFTTGDTVQEGTRQFLAESGQPYLMKPFDLAELEARLRSVASA